ncbi:MAG TPA: hypothetical protein DDW33_04375 [Ktedonobacter sp.]|nr:hypothetical protein [Ktedonobacter sp.]HAT43500.1 hypothetical protein [Ktedonobacter sp.]HBE24907.1 hypothetical protein [Ktedonobacter sp.]HCF87199.1 hypothetical protein [Ktedonobacter sp.]HCP74575.1 hypothetical protein [Ktedonobacter sp.]
MPAVTNSAFFVTLFVTFRRRISIILETRKRIDIQRIRRTCGLGTLTGSDGDRADREDRRAGASKTEAVKEGAARAGASPARTFSEMEFIWRQ